MWEIQVLLLLTILQMPLQIGISIWSKHGNRRFNRFLIVIMNHKLTIAKIQFYLALSTCSNDARMIMTRSSSYILLGGQILFNEKRMPSSDSPIKFLLLRQQRELAGRNSTLSVIDIIADKYTWQRNLHNNNSGKFFCCNSKYSFSYD